MTNPKSEAFNADMLPSRLAEEEERIVSELTFYLSEGDSYFVISKRWYMKVQAFVKYTRWVKYITTLGGAPRPGPIDNHDIIIDTTSDDDDPQLRRFLIEDEDYVLLRSQVWKTLLGWYSGGPTILMNLIYLFLSDARYDNNNVTFIRLAKQATIRELYHNVCAMKRVSQEKAFIWDYFNMKKGKLLHPLSNMSLEDSGLLMDQDILLEVDDDSSSSQYAKSSVENELPLEPSGKGLAGLVNLGNTCYMNSTLQCLAHTPPLVQYFLRDYTVHNLLGISGELAKAFGELLKKLWSSGRNTVAPRFFKTKLDKAAPQFSGYNQHDSHELLMSLLARLHEVSDIVNVCQGQCKSTLVCSVCGEIANAYEAFTCLSLPLPSTRTCSLSLLSCLEEYLAEEPLGPDNMWFCPECKKKRQANKKLDLYKLPEILVLHLKRFRSRKNLVKKIDTFVNFPINDLDLSKYVTKYKKGKSYMYDLYAVSNHHSRIGDVSHYTAYVKVIDYNKWYHFNDSIVSSVNESEIKSSAAYLLFYRRRKVGRETKAQSSED